MYKTIFLYFVGFVLSTVQCYGQFCFNKLYGSPKPCADLATAPVIEVLGEGFIFPYTSWNYQLGERQIVVQKINYKGDTLWKRIYGKLGYKYDAEYISQCKDGNYIIAGYCGKLSDSFSYYYILKINQNGDSLWSKKYTTGAWLCVLNKVIETTDTGFVFVGGHLPYDTNSNSMPSQIYVLKTDNMGNRQWEKQFGGVNYEFGCSIAEVGDKGFLISGYTSSYGAGGLDAYVVKTDSIGNFKWHQTYGTGFDEAVSDITQLKDGNYLLAGEVNYNYPGPNNGQAMIIKIKPDGSVVWQKKYGGIELTTFNSIIELSNGDIVAAGGNNNTSKYNQAGWIMKAKSSGDSLWARIYDNTPYYGSLFYKIVSTQDKGFIISGSAIDTDTANFSSEAWVLKVDSMGCDVAGCQFVGVKEQRAFSGGISVFPNPSNGNFTIKSGAVLKKGEVMDVLGNVVYSDDNILSISFDISLSQLSNGIYFLKVADVHDKGQVRKIIIEH